MKKLQLFALMENLDKTEGRGPLRDVFYTKNEDLALKILSHPAYYKKYGVMGCPEGKYLVKEKEIIILDCWEDFVKLEGVDIQAIEESERNEALKKLSDREKKLLKLI